jgi:23S rRNA maturation-related 3'-5' exoribonuclease YhaM
MLKTREQITALLYGTCRPGVEWLVDWMNNNGFFEAPCSTQYHLADKGGLAKHSLNVYENAVRLAVAFGADVNRDSLVLAALLHDLGKAGQFGKPEYKPNYLKNGDLSKAKPWEKNKELLPVDHEVRSIAIASQFIQLTEDEQFAILMHNGPYGTFRYGFQGNETQLYMLVHFADMWCSRVTEQKGV